MAMSSAACISFTPVFPSVSRADAFQTKGNWITVRCSVSDRDSSPTLHLLCSQPGCRGRRSVQHGCPRIPALPLGARPPDGEESGDAEGGSEEGAVVFKRGGTREHYEVESSLESLGLHALSSELSRTAAISMGLKAAKSDSATPVSISWNVSKQGRDLRLNGVARTAISAICNRCLAPMAERISGEFSLLLTEKPVEEPTQEKLGVVLGALGQGQDLDEEALRMLDLDLDDKMHFPREASQLDISKYIRDTVHLEIPAKSICVEACKGLCLSCGVNLNRSSCKCVQKEKDDGRWNALEQLRKQLREQEGRAD